MPQDAPRRWPQFAIDLLRKNIEEYRNIDFIDNRRRLAHVQESTPRKISVEKREGKKESKKEGKKERKNQSSKMRKFTPEEDKELMKIQKLDKKTVTDLCKKFNRKQDSIRRRFKKLCTVNTSVNVASNKQ